ncbi:MAG: protein-L-isoaspartate(D-aspartate) O-methyltransferase [Bacteroidales bacterium]
MEDSFKHKGLRKMLVECIENKGISNQKVLQAINQVPRHLFLDSSFLSYAYEDKPFPIGCKQTISQPFTVAFQTQLLDVQKGEKVLEIGTGSGYQACVLAEMGAKVFTVERQKKLYFRAKSLLPKLGYPQIKCFYSDGNKGLPTFGPFHKILVTCAATEIPENLIEQLRPNGILVIPVGNSEKQEMFQIIKNNDNSLTINKNGDFRFVPLLRNKADDN